MRTVSVGHITHDRIGEQVILGGSAYYSARIYRALGSESTLCTGYGPRFTDPDAFGGLMVHASMGHRTTTFENVYDAGGQRQQIIHAVGPSLVKHPPTTHVDVLHLAPVFGEMDLSHWSSFGRPRYLAANLQGWLRSTVQPLPSRVVPRLWSHELDPLKCIDVAFVSDEDLIGQEGLFQALRASVPMVVRTRGADGAELYRADERIRIGAYAADVVDPTGAGDGFAAGFMFALADGADPTAALRLGTAVASIIIEAQGTDAVGRLQVEARTRAATLSV